jgi:hypothetical protein
MVQEDANSIEKQRLLIDRREQVSLLVKQCNEHVMDAGVGNSTSGFQRFTSSKVQTDYKLRYVKF